MPALEELLLGEPETNLFLLGYMDAVPVHHAHWYGAVQGERVVAAVLVVPGRLAVPFAPDPSHAARLGALLQGRHRPSMMVGPREACDAFWWAWAPGTPIARWNDQRLLVCHEAPPGGPVPGFRRARPDELAEVIRLSAAMECEDIGRRPLDEDAVGFAAVVQRRIEHGQTWILERERRIAFLINVGTSTTWGVQVGGTYVPPDLRGRGLAREGMTEMVRRLRARHPVVTLHVNAANTPAMRTYQATGFREHALFRLILVGETS